MKESTTSEDFERDLATAEANGAAAQAGQNPQADCDYAGGFDENFEGALAGTESDSPFADGSNDNWSYEVPRPWLSIDEAANMLGRSVRGMERSIIGRWGNKLPEGWQARRVRIDGVDQWRIVPPPGFKIKHSRKMDPSTRAALAQMEQERQKDLLNQKEWLDSKELLSQKESELEAALSQCDAATRLEHAYHSTHASTELFHTPIGDYNSEDKEVPSKRAESSSGFSLEKLFQSAGQLAQKELASLGLNVKNQLIADSANYANNLQGEHTIVIDRSDEVEKLLRELANTQKELAEERRQHMEDMRLINQLQNNMRLLEVNATQTSELKDDLRIAQKLLSEHKKEYQAYLALPWWKKIFKSQP